MTTHSSVTSSLSNTYTIAYRIHEAKTEISDMEDNKTAPACSTSSSTPRLKTPSYRYKYTQDTVSVLSRFAKENMNSGRSEFVSSWKVFIETEEMVKVLDIETKLLEKSGYIGSVLTKMYKSVRYYFVKKARLETLAEKISSRKRGAVSLEKEIKEEDNNNNKNNNKQDKHHINRDIKRVCDSKNIDVIVDNVEIAETESTAHPTPTQNENESRMETLVREVSELASDSPSPRTRKSNDSLSGRVSDTYKKRAYFKLSEIFLQSIDNFIKKEIKVVERINSLYRKDKVDQDKEEVQEESEYSEISEYYDGEDGLNGEGVESGKAEKREEEVSSESSKDRLKPSILYDKYCEQYEENIEEEMKNMIKLSYPEDMMFKIKKTFKNRCYSIFSQK